ncbi:MAG: hypothetical protein IPG97_14945 [Microthrixaceae bacterium]|nr:hypothetical protein [Microthrixaceae bacterium]
MGSAATRSVDDLDPARVPHCPTPASAGLPASPRDRRTADSMIVTAAGELVDRLRVEVDRLHAEVEQLRAEVEQCQQRHAEVVATIGRLTTDP